MNLNKPTKKSITLFFNNFQRNVKNIFEEYQNLNTNITFCDINRWGYHIIKIFGPCFVSNHEHWSQL